MYRIPKLLIFIPSILILLLLVLGINYYRSHVEDANIAINKNLKIIADLKASQINNWLYERNADATMIMVNHLLIDEIQKWFTSKDEQRYKIIKHYFQNLKENYGYNDVLIANINHEIVFSLNDRYGNLHKTVIDSLKIAFSKNTPVITDLHKGPDNLPAHLDLVIPIKNNNTLKVFATIILRCEADQFLYPLIQTWPIRSNTAETLLGRREGDKVVFVNELRHVRNAAFNLRFPVNSEDLPLAMAARGIEGIVEGNDYRSEKVIAVTKIIKDTPWFMVAKIDKKEAYASANRESLYILGIFAFIILMVLFFSFYIWQYLDKKHLKILYNTKLALWTIEEKHRVTLQSIGDAVITTDENGRVKFMNTVAEQLTGWSIKEALEQPLEEVFKIYNEDTLNIVENPVRKVVESGKIVGLANHTILHSKDGKEYAIADSGAPIKDNKGEIKGVVLVFRDQSFERNVQKRLEESEAKYRTLFENMTEAFALHKLIYNEEDVAQDYIFLEVNSAFEKLTGLKRSDIIGKKVTEVIPGIRDDSANWIQRYGNVTLFKKENYFEDYSQQLNKWYAVHAFPGQKDTFATTFTDITERKIIEKNLIETGKKYKTLIENLPGMAYRCYIKPDWPMIFCSEESKNITGYTSEMFTKENSGVKYGDLIHPDDKQYVWDSIQKHINNKTHFSIEYRILTKHSEIKWVWEKGRSVSYSGYEEPLLEGLIMDITPLKKTEEMLKERESRLRSLIDTIPDMVWIKDTQGAFIACNPEFEKLYGAKEKDIIGKTDFDFVDKELAEFFREKDKIAIENKKPTINEEEVIFASDGHKAILETIKTPMFYKNKELMGVLGIARDITTRKKAEQEIRKLSTSIEQSPLLIIITDPQGVIEYVNPTFCKTTGYSKDEIVGQNPRILNSGEHSGSFYQDLWKTIKQGNVWRGEFKNRKKNGELYWENATISPIHSENNEIMHFIGLKEDITKTKELEDQLLQSQKLEAIGQLAGGVAHDFNNMLTVINGYSSLLINQMGPSNRYYHDVEQIAKAGERAGLLTTQLLAFSRKQVIKPVVLNINSIVKDLQKILVRLIGENIKIETNLAPDLKNIKADFGQINQVIMNLAINARDAIPGNGRLIIETKNIFVDDDQSAKHLDIKPGNYIVLSVIDNGTGMDKKTQDRIFEPFFTTKEKGKGTGLGLSTVYGIVKQNNGSIWLYSELNKGTTFRIYFPQIEISGIQREKAADNLKIKSGSETVLVVEDDKNVLELTKAILQSGGYNVIPLLGGDITKKQLNEIKTHIDVLVTDVVMSGLNGKKISEHLRKERPGLKVIFMSGYTDDLISKSGILNEGIVFLQKPFLSYDLLKTVRDILDKDD